MYVLIIVTCMQIVHFVDKLNLWHRLPVFLGLLYLGARRHLHQEYNLINVGKTPIGVRSNPADHPYRTADGKYNDPFNEGAGSELSFFGRNMLPVDQHNQVYFCEVINYRYCFPPILKFSNCPIILEMLCLFELLINYQPPIFDLYMIHYRHHDMVLFFFFLFTVLFVNLTCVLSFSDTICLPSLLF